MTRGDRERLRAELAGKAMQGILSNPSRCVPEFEGAHGKFQELVAQVSLEFADALLAELDRTAEDPIKAGGTE